VLPLLLLLLQQLLKMKVGFAKKSKQKKNKQKKNKKKGAADGDDMMPDVQQPGSPVDAELAQAGEQLSAKDKQRKRMELKKALRVKVSSLKQDRCVSNRCSMPLCGVAACMRARGCRGRGEGYQQQM
jgi:hypothetical protein